MRHLLYDVECFIVFAVVDQIMVADSDVLNVAITQFVAEIMNLGATRDAPPARLCMSAVGSSLDGA